MDTHRASYTILYMKQMQQSMTDNGIPI